MPDGVLQVEKLGLQIAPMGQQKPRSVAAFRLDISRRGGGLDSWENKTGAYSYLFCETTMSARHKGINSDSNLDHSYPYHAVIPWEICCEKNYDPAYSRAHEMNCAERHAFI